MSVDAEHLDGRRHLGPLDRALGGTGGDGEAELGVVLARGDVVVGLGFDPGREPQEDLRGDAGLGVQHVETIEFVKTVDDDATDAGLDRHPKLGDRLVVAVQHESLSRNPGVERNMEFATGCDVEVHAFLMGEAGHRPAQKRLRGVGDTIAECLDRLTAAITEMLFVVDENRGAELLSKLKRVAPSDVEHAVDDLGRVGQQAGGQRTHGYIASGAETPSSCRAIWRPTWLAATSARRAWVSSGAMASLMT